MNYCLLLPIQWIYCLTPSARLLRLDLHTNASVTWEQLPQFTNASHGHSLHSSLVNRHQFAHEYNKLAKASSVKCAPFILSPTSLQTWCVCCGWRNYVTARLRILKIIIINPRALDYLQQLLKVLLTPLNALLVTPLHSMLKILAHPLNSYPPEACLMISTLSIIIGEVSKHHANPW